MKLNFYVLSILGLSFGLLLTSCDQLKDLSYSTTPNPLEMHGDSVTIAVTVNIPPKGINKKVIAEITPTLGNTKLSTWKIQGEKATGNGQTITFKPGGSATFSEVVAYDPSMESSELAITAKVFKGTKEKTKEAIPATKLADATIITPLMVRPAFMMLTETVDIPRSENKTASAQLNFLKGKDEVRATELKDKDILDLVTWIQTAQTNPKIKINSIAINGYASPDGEETYNDPLSGRRTRTARTAVIAVMKKNNLTQYLDTNMYALSGNGEDMAGFQNALAQSTTIKQEDKDLFSRVLSMGGQNDKKEDDIYALSKGFTQLEKEIFPALRRAEVVVSYTEMGLSDDELRAKAMDTPAAMSADELIFTASKLVKDLNDQGKIYDAAALSYPTDARALNNAGAVAYMQGNYAKAKANFDKALSAKDNNKTKNNLAGVAMVQGDRATAKKLLGQVKEKNAEINYNNAIIALLEGKYSSAVTGFNAASFNKALAQVLVGTLDAASETLAKSNDKDAADGFYLKAIIAARSNAGVDAIVSNLKSAIAKNSQLREKAGKDREFIKFIEDPTFSAAVR